MGIAGRWVLAVAVLAAYRAHAPWAELQARASCERPGGGYDFPTHQTFKIAPTPQPTPEPTPTSCGARQDSRAHLQPAQP